LEEELSKVNEMIERVKEEIGGKEAAAEREIMELREINGKLQLELKCSNQQVELYEYHLSAERNKVERLQVQLHAAHINEASLRSAVDSTVGSLIDTPIEPSMSKSSLPKLSEDAAEVGTTATINVSKSGVIFTQSTLNASSIGQSVVTLPSIVHTSQVLPLSKFSGSNDNETFKEWHEQFELVATVCGWNSQSKLANLVTRLQGQAYAFYHTCTAQQRSSYESLVMAMSQRFTPVRIQSVQSGLFHSHRQKVNERVDTYAQDLNRLYQKAYPQTNQRSQETETMGKAVLAYQFVSGLLPEIQVKVAGIEGTFNQLWIKACFEEAKLRDLSSRDGAGKFSSKPTQFRPENSHYSQSSNHGTPNRKCYVCAKVGHLAKNCPQQGRGRPAESQG